MKPNYDTLLVLILLVILFVYGAAIAVFQQTLNLIGIDEVIFLSTFIYT